MYGPEDYEYQPRARKGPSIVGSIVASIITSIAVFFALRYLEQQGYVSAALGQGTIDVPAVVGMTSTEARTALAGRGLMLVLEAEREDVKVPAGAVMAQKPLPGSQIRRGSTVFAIVSRGVGQMPVPNVVGEPSESAIRKLGAAGLKVEATKPVAGDGPPGVVLAMAPAAGTMVIPGASIDLQVSAARTTKAVPKVMGLKVVKAKETITAAGFTVGKVVYDYDDERGVNVVLRQTPPAGTQAGPGTPVNLVINEP